MGKFKLINHRREPKKTPRLRGAGGSFKIFNDPWSSPAHWLQKHTVFGSAGMGKTHTVARQLGKTCAFSALYGSDTHSTVTEEWERKILGSFDNSLGYMQLDERANLSGELRILSDMELSTPEEYRALDKKEHLRYIEALLPYIFDQALISYILCDSIDTDEIMLHAEYSNIVKKMFKKITNKKYIYYIRESCSKYLRRYRQQPHTPLQQKADLLQGQCEVRLELLSNNSIHFLLED
ncbi:hypothetical protein N9948_01670 [bacterium]|nr:hypothetical protein [bacterium]